MSGSSPGTTTTWCDRPIRTSSWAAQIARYARVAAEPSDGEIGREASDECAAQGFPGRYRRACLRGTHGRFEGVSRAVRRIPGGTEFLEELDALTAEFMDITYGSERLLNRPDLLLHTLLELARHENRELAGRQGGRRPRSGELERRFFTAVGPAEHEEAAEVLRIGRVSWRLRDDDNLLLSRVESQLFRAVDLALTAPRRRPSQRRSQT